MRKGRIRPDANGGAVSEEPGSERVIAGRYRLLSPLGEGGMGTVWRARDEVLHREVAVKEVRAPAGLPASDVERMYARLEREAWAAARIADRTVVTVYDVATEDGRPWIVMELVRGLSLAEVLDAEGPCRRRGPRGSARRCWPRCGPPTLRGVLHRDVKPANVLIANDGRVVLTDFGIATVEGSSALTMTGEVVGSPEFLAPERALGRTPVRVGPVVAGRAAVRGGRGPLPFRQDTPLSTLRAIVDEELPPPRRAGPLAPVIEGLLRKDPAERPLRTARWRPCGSSPPGRTGRGPRAYGLLVRAHGGRAPRAAADRPVSTTPGRPSAGRRSAHGRHGDGPAPAWPARRRPAGRGGGPAGARAGRADVRAAGPGRR